MKRYLVIQDDSIYTTDVIDADTLDDMNQGMVHVVDTTLSKEFFQGDWWDINER